VHNVGEIGARVAPGIFEISTAAREVATVFSCELGQVSGKSGGAFGHARDKHLPALREVHFQRTNSVYLRLDIAIRCNSFPGK